MLAESGPVIEARSRLGDRENGGLAADARRPSILSWAVDRGGVVPAPRQVSPEPAAGESKAPWSRKTNVAENPGRRTCFAKAPEEGGPTAGSEPPAMSMMPTETSTEEAL